MPFEEDDDQNLLTKNIFGNDDEKSTVSQEIANRLDKEETLISKNEKRRYLDFLKNLDSQSVAHFKNILDLYEFWFDSIMVSILLSVDETTVTVLAMLARASEGSLLMLLTFSTQVALSFWISTRR